MSAERRAGAVGIAVLALLVGAGIAFDGRGDAPPRLAMPNGSAFEAVAPTADCPTWQLATGQGQVAGSSAALYSDGMLLLTPCAGATVELSLRGTLAAGRGPWTVVEAGAVVVFAGHVDEEGAALRLVGPARLTFSNDVVVGGEDRNLRATVR